MIAVYASIAGAIATQFVVGIFFAGKMFQRVDDIDKWIREKTVETDRRLVRLEGNPGCTESDNEKAEG